MSTAAKPFLDRQEAGQKLACRLNKYAHRPDVLVLGLPRGGVPVAAEVARFLNVPLDVCLVRKLGVPGQKELAMGAIATGGVQIWNEDVVSWLDISDQTIANVVASEERELQRRELVYRGNRPPPQIHDRIVILVDDGLATGSTMKAAISVVKAQQPSRLVVAVPVGPAETCNELNAEVDEVVCLLTPESFSAIGLWYNNFTQTSDQEVKAILANTFPPNNQPTAV